MTRLFATQRRLRFVRGLAQGLRWFAVGSLLAALGLLVLWNWDRLPGPWQWLASAGRPRELLWLPLLVALGGFASRWLLLPSARETAYKLDQLRGSKERLLTAVDWILSEKPRTAASERLLESAAQELDDEGRLRQDFRNLEKVGKTQYALLLTLLAPLALLFWLPAHVGLPESAAIWMGNEQVDRLTEAMVEELEQTVGLEKPEEKLKELLQKLAQANDTPEIDKRQQNQAQQELQQAIDRIKQMAKGQESGRQLLETLAERARQGQELSQEDRDALDALKQMMSKPQQQEAVEAAESAWSEGQNEQAAEALESLQQQAGEAAQGMQQMAAEGEAQNEAAPGSGQEFDEQQGDQHNPDSQGQGQGQGQEQGQGQGQGQGRGQGQGMQGEGDQPSDFGRGTTEQDQGGPGGTSGRQSLRQSDHTSDKSEEFHNLHPPTRTEEQTSQSKVQGQADRDGPRFRTEKEGLGEVTEPSQIRAGGTLLEYREDAENALLREEIPADQRDEVRQYFEALDQ